MILPGAPLREEACPGRDGGASLSVAQPVPKEQASFVPSKMKFERSKG